MTLEEYKKLKTGDKIIFARASSFFWKNVIGIIKTKADFGDGWYVNLPNGTNQKSINDIKYFNTTISIHDIEYTDILIQRTLKSHLPKWF